MPSVGTFVKAAFRAAGIHALSWKNMPWGVSVERDLQRILGANNRSVVFDVGANVGQTAIRFHRALPRTTIYCFEPIPDTFKHLERNVRGLPSVIPKQLAVGEVNGFARMVVARDSEQSRFLRKDDAPLENVIQVEMVRIDGVASKEGISEISILKTDCEGFDLDALKGAEAMLRAGKIRAVLSEVTLNERSFHSQFAGIHDFLTGFGFYFFAFYDYNGWGSFHSQGQFHNSLWLKRQQS